MLAQELPEGFPLVGGGIIQQHNDRATQVPQQLTQKHTDLFGRCCRKRVDSKDPGDVAAGSAKFLK